MHTMNLGHLSDVLATRCESIVNRLAAEYGWPKNTEETYNRARAAIAAGYATGDIVALVNTYELALDYRAQAIANRSDMCA